MLGRQSLSPQAVLVPFEPRRQPFSVGLDLKTVDPGHRV